MKYAPISVLLILVTVVLVSSCSSTEACTETIWYEDADSDDLGNANVSRVSCDQPDGFVADNTDPNDEGINGTPLSAFDEFNPDAVTFSFDGDEVTIETNGLPNHTSPYWPETSPLHIDQTVGDHVTPGTISEGSFIVTVPLFPELASTSSATGLGPIGIAVTGATIFNDLEGPNRALDANTITGFDYAGGHNGPGGYHYHIESFDVPENTSVSFDDANLVGILADGFLLYGRKEPDGTYPADLDESGGHLGVTSHSSNGEEIYHYHIINEVYLSAFFLLFGGDLKGTPNTIR